MTISVKKKAESFREEPRVQVALGTSVTTMCLAVCCILLMKQMHVLHHSNWIQVRLAQLSGFHQNPLTQSGKLLWESAVSRVQTWLYLKAAHWHA